MATISSGKGEKMADREDSRVNIEEDNMAV
jgi:hypothetical protein